MNLNLGNSFIKHHCKYPHYLYESMIYTYQCHMEEIQANRGVRRTQNMVLLPWELIIEILLKLPVRSLVRFKCVCKSWFSLISSLHFARSHFELATERLLFIKANECKVRSIDLNASLHNDSASYTLKPKFLYPRNTIIGSCRGFLAVESVKTGLNNINIWVWNPSTGVHKLVHSSPIITSDYTLLHGFGYDPSTDDYLLVQVFYKSSYNSRSHDDANRAKFFSLKNNASKEIEITHHYKCSCYGHHEAGTLLNDVIHWMAFSSDISMDVIVTFDLTERRFLNMSLPLDFECQNFRLSHLVVLGGLLSLSAQEWHDNNHSVEIWTMKKYKVRSSWTKTIVVSYQDYIPERYFRTICSTKSGDIVGSDEESILAKCNDKGEIQELRSYSSSIYDPFCLSVVYQESLLSLPCDNEQVGIDD